MIKDFTTYINEGLFDRNQSEFVIKKTDKGIEQVYTPKTNSELHKYIDLDIEQAKKDGTYPDVNLKNIDVSGLGDDELRGLFGDNGYKHINPDISNWNIKYIPSSFFYNNKQIKEFTIPNNITSIGLGAFSGCSGLTSVTIPNSVKSIGNGTFWGCSLTSVTIPDSVTSIGKWAFDYGKSLTSVTIPDSVEIIECYAFDHCNNLTSVTIPNNCRISPEPLPSFQENCEIIRRDDFFSKITRRDD